MKLHETTHLRCEINVSTVNKCIYVCSIFWRYPKGAVFSRDSKFACHSHTFGIAKRIFYFRSKVIHTSALSALHHQQVHLCKSTTQAKLQYFDLINIYWRRSTFKTTEINLLHRTPLSIIMAPTTCGKNIEKSEKESKRIRASPEREKTDRC